MKMTNLNQMLKKDSGLIAGKYTPLKLTQQEEITAEQSTVDNIIREPFRLELAAVCGHAISPGTLQIYPIWCPSCHVKSLLLALKKSTKKWEKRRGPKATAANHTPSWFKARKAWYNTKVKLLNYMCSLELWAEQEQAWVAEHSATYKALGKEAANIQTSKAALAVAQMGMPYCDVMPADLVPPNKPETKHSVKFADDAFQFPERLYGSFDRASEVYQPGRWSATEGNDLVETSFSSYVDFGDPRYDADLDMLWEEGA